LAQKFPRWTAAETDKALCILRNMTGSDNICKIYGEESVPKEELMSAIYENNVKESVLNSEFMSKTEIHEKGVNESVSNKETVRLRDLRPFIDLMRGVKSVPCEYYHHVMHGGEEIDSFADSILGTGTGKAGLRISANLRACSVLQNPKAVYIVVGVDAQDTSDVYGGYVYEIFVDDSLYNI
nr:hypothetical protein [Tanacetum cinerariifolium]